MTKSRQLFVLSILAFYIVAIAVLVAGYLPTQMLWGKDHHRYDYPNTGYYYGSVSGYFDSTEEAFYSVGFMGKTKPHWCWRYPNNFVYRSLEIRWRNEEAEGIAIVQLPSLAYQSSNVTGVLTRNVLVNWLLGATNTSHSVTEVRRIDTVFEFIQAAGKGTLPPPNHHGHYYDEPIRGRIQHFLLGFGVGSYFYIWAAVWLLMVLWGSWTIWKRLGRSALREAQP